MPALHEYVKPVFAATSVPSLQRARLDFVSSTDDTTFESIVI